MTEEELLLQHLLDKSARVWNSIHKLRKHLQESGTCSHYFTSPYNWESDDGYGGQDSRLGRRCLSCWAVDRWDEGKFRLPEVD